MPSAASRSRPVTSVLLPASLWLAMMRRFADAIDVMPHGRSLDAERFFSDPREPLEQVAKLFGMAAAPAELDAVAPHALGRRPGQPLHR